MSRATNTPPASACEVHGDVELSRPDTPESMDTDSDMSDGGVPFTMSHEERLNAEMNDLDREIMGEENFNDLLNDNHTPVMDGDVEFDPTTYQDNEMESSAAGDLLGTATLNIPAAFATVAAQIQSIQNAGVQLAAGIQNIFDGTCPNFLPPSLLFLSAYSASLHHEGLYLRNRSIHSGACSGSDFRSHI